MSISGSEVKTASIKASSRIRGMQRTALVMLVISGLVNYVDRATLAVANPLIRKDLNLSVAQMGILLSCFLSAYAFSQLPVGALIDRFSPRIVLPLGICLWSAAQVMCGFVRNLGQFAVARLLLGIGESPQFPTAGRITREWFNRRERGLATATWNSTSALGTAIAVPLLTFLIIGFGWRGMFVFMGVADLLMAAAFYLLYRNPGDLNLTAEEQAYLAEGESPGQHQIAKITLRDWIDLLKQNATLGMALTFFAMNYGLWIFNAWLPTYLEMEFHFTLVKTGIFGSIPFFIGFVGAFSTGFLCDFLVRRGVDPVRSRKVLMLTGMVGGACFMALTAIATTSTMALICVAGSMFLLNMTSTATWAMVSVLVSANRTASLGAMQNFGGYFGAALAPMVTGFTVQATNSFQTALWVGTAVIATGSALCFLCIRTPVANKAVNAAAADA